MRTPPSCPRCRGSLRPPGLWSDSWQCREHGTVLPLHPAGRPTAAAVTATLARAQVPVWVPWPLPQGWLVTGLAHVGDERSGARAVVLACSGPNPVGGAGELLIVAEEPGIGLGAAFAGLPGPDPGPAVAAFLGAPDAKLRAGAHDCPLWCVPGGEGRAVYVGEAYACWLWVVMWPDSAAALLMDRIELADLRTIAGEVDLLPFGALSPQLA